MADLPCQVEEERPAKKPKRWHEAVCEAREILQIEGFQPVGGATQGQRLRAVAQALCRRAPEAAAVAHGPKTIPAGLENLTDPFVAYPFGFDIEPV